VTDANDEQRKGSDPMKRSKTAPDIDISVALHVLGMAENGGVIDLCRKVAADDSTVHVLAEKIAAFRDGRSLEEAFDLSEDHLDEHVETVRAEIAANRWEIETSRRIYHGKPPLSS
jgi:hypothetical protein